MSNLDETNHLNCSICGAEMVFEDAASFVNPKRKQVVIGRSYCCPNCKTKIYQPDPAYLEASIRGYDLRRKNEDIGHRCLCVCTSGRLKNRVYRVLHIDYETEQCGCQELKKRPSIAARTFMKFSQKRNNSDLLWIPITQLTPLDENDERAWL